MNGSASGRGVSPHDRCTSPKRHPIAHGTGDGRGEGCLWGQGRQGATRQCYASSSTSANVRGRARAAVGKSARQRSWLDVDDATSRTSVITLAERQHAAADTDTHTLPSYVSTPRQLCIALAVLSAKTLCSAADVLVCDCLPLPI